MSDSAKQGRLMLLASSAAALQPYLAAADKLQVLTACGVEAAEAAPDMLPLRFARRESALEVVQYSLDHPLAAIVAADEPATPTCARAASMMGLHWHTPKAADICLDKFAVRQKLSNSGFNSPVLGDAPAGRDLTVAALLDGGRLRVLGAVDVHHRDTEGAESGRNKNLRDLSASVLNVGVTDVARAALETGLRAARSLGLIHGPLALRLRLVGQQVWIIDVAAAIPLALGDILHFRIPLVDEDVSLAEVITRHALGVDVSRIYRR